MGLQDHAWVITTFLEEILDKWWSQISPWDRGGMRDLAVQFNKLIRDGLSVDEINSFFISHFEYAQSPPATSGSDSEASAGDSGAESESDKGDVQLVRLDAEQVARLRADEA